MTNSPECGFGYRELQLDDVAGLVRRTAREIRERLGATLSEPDGVPILRRRIDPTAWSVLEYAGHVRDLVLYRHDNLYAALVVDNPEIESMHQNERAALGGYIEEDPATTAAELTLAADLFV